MPTEIVSIAEAQRRSGLRLLSIAGIPSPWTEAVKGFLRWKGLAFVLVQASAEDGLAAAAAWVGDVGIPALVRDDHPPLTGWAEILLALERQVPTPPLLPQAAEARADVLGVSHEICGQEGLGWALRWVMIDRSLNQPDDPGFPAPVGAYLAPRYGYFPGAGAEGKARSLALLKAFAARLEAQPYLCGTRATAADIYLAVFLNLVDPLAPALMPTMDATARRAYRCRDADLQAAFTPRLRAHQEKIYRDHLEVPVVL